MSGRERPIVGVDIDGVLANQVDGVLVRVNARHGLELVYDDVIHWDAPLGPETSFHPAIKEAFGDEEFVSEMPVHDGSLGFLVELAEIFEVAIVTSRHPEFRDATERWLAKNELPHDRLCFADADNKASSGAVVLIDDYPPTLTDFISATNGFGILLDQPWNRGENRGEAFAENSRLSVANSLAEAARLAADYAALTGG